MAVVIAVALGPVSSFIAGGRRSRDLWYGSRFLSEATRRAAEVLVKAGARLDYPLPARLGQRFTEKHEGPTISNKILCRMDTEDPRHALADAEAAARTFLANEIRAIASDKRTRRIAVAKDLEAQAVAVEAGDFLELYAAWTPDTQTPEAVNRAFRLLDARKRTRTFQAPSWTRPGVGKSSLDPGRDTVLVEIDAREHPAAVLWLDVMRAQAYVRPEERLDGVGLARRRAIFRIPDAELPALQFPSLARVALDPWIEGAWKQQHSDLAKVRDLLQDLHEKRPNRDVSPLFLLTSPVRDPQPAIQFGFDPEIFLENAVAALRRSLGDMSRKGRPSVVPHGDPPAAEQVRSDHLESVLEAAKGTLERLSAPIANLHRARGVPIPYVAILAADGDGIGAKIAEASTRGASLPLVSALYRFADAAWKMIADHGGCAFYVGGDELTAYLPVDVALVAARDLAELFRAEMANVKEGASLSVGVAVGHVKEDMRALRARAQGALGAAKERRRARDLAAGHLAVAEEPRGGPSRMFAGAIQDVVAQHLGFRELLALGEGQGLSLATAHHLLELAERFKPPNPPPGSGEEETGGDLGLALAHASVLRKIERADKGPLPAIVTAIRACEHWRDVRELAAEILFAERALRIADQRRRDPESKGGDR